MVSHDSKIIVVGAGVFGLSSALWLARDGYRDITVFDRCAFDKSKYNPQDGCDGASADINKIFRTSYGTKHEYQALATEARKFWLEWNQAIRASDVSQLPPGVTPNDKLLDVCGVYYLAEGPNMLQYYADGLETIGRTAPEIRDLQFIKGNAEEEARLRQSHCEWAAKYHALDTLRNGNTNGFLDISGGITLADKACIYARFLCEQAGVKFVLGEPQGKLQSLITEPHSSDGQKRVTGIKTCDGLVHSGDLVIVACGAWTALIVPEAHRTVEATAGTLMFIDVPKDREDLRQKFHPDRFPVWHYRREDGDGSYQGGGFPITTEGRLKFGFRARKFTNFQAHPTVPNLRISTPRTKYSQNPITTVPSHGLTLMKEVIGQTFPELAEIGFTDSRLYWYTDSIDNDYVIDYVPGYLESLFICSGGSGHGFKMLPILGKYVKTQLERIPSQFTPLWKWRVVEQGKDCNGLEQGETGPRDMSKVPMADPRDFKFQ